MNVTAENPKTDAAGGCTEPPPPIGKLALCPCCGTMQEARWFIGGVCIECYYYGPPDPTVPENAACPEHRRRRNPAQNTDLKRETDVVLKPKVLQNLNDTVKKEAQAMGLVQKGDMVIFLTALKEGLTDGNNFVQPDCI